MKKTSVQCSKNILITKQKRFLPIIDETKGKGMSFILSYVSAVRSTYLIKRVLLEYLAFPLDVRANPF